MANGLCFSKLVGSIKNSLASNDSDEFIVNELITPIVEKYNLKNKNNEPFYLEKSRISRLLSGSEEVPKALHTTAGSMTDFSFMIGHIETFLLKIKVGFESILVNELKLQISSSTVLTQDIKDSLIESYASEGLPYFISNCLVWTLKIPNKITFTSDGLESRESSLSKRLPDPDIPSTISEVEKNQPYILKLLEAFSDSENVNINFDNLNKYGKYNRSFSRNRKAYYAAEDVNRRVRDIYPEDEENQFDVLKEETYQGIIDVWDQDYESGFERLNGVLEHSTKISLSTCKLVTDTKWITTSKKRRLPFSAEEGSIEGWIINEQTI